MTDDPEAALLAAVQSNPNDTQAREIYADWLEERGDPRGEYLRLEVQRARIPMRLAELASRIDPAWLGALGGRYQIAITAIGENKILAVKNVREVTGLGLRESVDLVERASVEHPALLFEELTFERAQEIVAKLEPVMQLRVEPPMTRAVSPGGPGTAPHHRPYRVFLVGILDRVLAIRFLHERAGKSLADARVIVDQIIAGTPFELARSLNAWTVGELACDLAPVGTVRIDHVPD